MFNNLKNKIINNLPTIITVTAIAGIVTAVAVSVTRQIKANAEEAAFVETLNAGLADGSLTAIVDNATGIIDIVETASIPVL